MTMTKSKTPARNAEGMTKAPTKQGSLIRLLERADGATLAEMTKATGWQVHSVRGVISGVFKKKLGLTVATTKGTYGTVYRIMREDVTG